MRAKLFCSRECAFQFRTKENHHEWKGDSASYSAIHKYVTAHFGKPQVCLECGTKGKRMNWANISRTYLRHREDWIELCAHCHKLFDLAEPGARITLVQKYTGKKAELINGSAEISA